MLENGISMFDEVERDMQEKCRVSHILDISNEVIIRGTLEDEPKCCYCYQGRSFYKTTIKIMRRSGTADYIYAVTENLGTHKGPLKGKTVELLGELRSERGSDGRKVIFFFAHDFTILSDEEAELKEDANILYLEGNICKPTIFRETPTSHKMVTDVLLQIDGAGRKEYINCLAWGDWAEQAANFCEGTRVYLYGRMQSRKYFKPVTKGSCEGCYLTRYEVSAFKIGLL